MSETSEALVEDGIDLSGHRILVVEGDLAIGSALCSDLKRYGATVLGPAPTSHYAYLLLMGRRGVDGAILNIDPSHQELYQLAEALRQRGVPVIFGTDGEDADSQLDGAFGDAPHFAKPMQVRQLAETMNRLILSPAEKPQPAADEPRQAVPQFSMTERLDRAITRAMRPAARR